MEEVFNLINICSTNPIQILNWHDFFKDCVCPSNDTYFAWFDNKKISMLVLGLHSKDRKSNKDKANINNPKVHTACLRKPRGTIHCKYYNFTAASFILLPRDLFSLPQVLFYCREFCFTASSFIFTTATLIFTNASFILPPRDLFYCREFYFHVKSWGSKIKLAAVKYKIGVKRRNTLGHQDQYMAQHGRIVKQSYCETV